MWIILKCSIYCFEYFSIFLEWICKVLNKIKAPNTYVVLSSIIVFIAILSWILPAGEFEREVTNGRNVVVQNSYHEVERNPQSIFEIMMAPLKGFISAAEIIGFVLIVGGAFSVFKKTEAVDAAIISIAKAHSKSKLVQKLLIPIFITIFSLAGAIFGMSEEIIPFILIFVPMTILLGYDSITGVAISFVGATVGFAGAFINPFTLGIAQGIAQLPLNSGLVYRLIGWFILTVATIIYVQRYANKIKANPQKSVMFKIDSNRRDKINTDSIDDHDGLDKKHKIVLAAFLLGLVVLVFGVLQFKWFIQEMCAVFIVSGIVVGALGKLSAKEITDGFIEGGKDLIGTAFVIALAKGIFVVSSDGKIIDTILNALASPISSFHPVISSQAMLATQSFINFFMFPQAAGRLR
jgi:uncharacterized ion transporter superfamily protein YfcC